MGETPGKKPQKFPAALACVDGVVGKTAAGRVDFSVCLDFVCLSVCVCVRFVVEFVMSPAVRYVRLFVNAVRESVQKLLDGQIINAITVAKSFLLVTASLALYI
jgi:hypothetical protein